MYNATPSPRTRREPHARAPAGSDLVEPITIGEPVRSPMTRVLHLLLLLMVMHQLAGSQFMEFPFPGDPPSWVFSLHEYIGLAGAAVVGGFWIWTIVRRGETRMGRLFPWFSPARLRDLVADLIGQLRRLLRLRAPDDEDGALASAVHGLGLLAVTAMVVTGTVYFFAAGTPVARPFLQVHKLFANLMWAYLVAHAGLAALHHLLGSDILSRMFWTRRGHREAAGRPALRRDGRY